RALQALTQDGVPEGQQRCDHSLDLRYFGQEYAVTLAVGRGEPLERVAERFHAAHERAYGHSSPGDRVEVVAARAVGWGFLGDLSMAPQPMAETDGEVVTRDVWFEDRYLTCRIHDRDGLKPGIVLRGPAIVEQLDTTTVLPPGYMAVLDDRRNLLLSEGHPG